MTAVKNIENFSPDWDLYRALKEQNLLSVHLFTLWRGGFTIKDTQAAINHVLTLPGPTSTLKKDDVLISGGIKLFIDGSEGGRTAWMNEDWNTNFRDVDTGNHGFPTTE